jgi:dienelactone hydrolase/pimeloyl-ACP methyl ester carboxylesterase
MAAPKPRRWIGRVPNVQHQPTNSVFDFPDYSLAIVEFDDQGRCYDRGQMEGLARKLVELSASDAIILLFVHGWKHDGRIDDDNLTRFREVAERIATEEKATPAPVPVLAIFAAWRGLSLYGLGVENLTFWGRKQAGLLVAMGAPRELFGRVRRFREARLQAGGAPLVVMVGHSFGGMIVYAALAQSLIEAAAMDGNVLVPSIADLVLLVNPAFEAARYLPIHDLVKARGEGGFTRNQRPVFVSVTARNDWATGIAFAAGMATARLLENTRGYEERQALIRTMGHLAWMRTHELSLRGPSEATGEVGRAQLRRIRFSENNPFWVVGATPEVINGHNGIWQQPFIDFVQSLILNHVRDRRPQTGGQAERRGSHSIDGYSFFDFTEGNISHRVYRKGTGPGVVIMHELPGMTEACISLADEVADNGFCVHLPLLFGEPGDNHPIVFAAELCISQEFRIFAEKGGSPIVDWLRALCRKIKSDCGGPGVGVIGLCLTGNFAIALMADDAVLAPVASEPSLPLFAANEDARKAIGVTDDELSRAQGRCIAGVSLMCLRFSSDRISPQERFEAIRNAFAPGFQGIVITSPDARHNISARAHSVLTGDFVNEPGHPTRVARDRVIDFLKARLLI